MRVLFLVFVAALLQATAHKHRGQHKAQHHSKRHLAKHVSKHHAAARQTSTYAHMQHSLNSMVKHTTEAENEVEISCRRLEEALLDAALAPSANATTPTKTSANATTPTLRGTSKLPGNLSSTLKLQQGKLGDLFSHLKENIANFNKRESEQKKDAAVYAERLKKRLEQDKKRLEDPKLSDFDREMLVNRTRTEEHELKFWTRGRELQHDMFHSNLKLTHGLMSRVKTVMDAYKQVMATGKLDAGLTKVLHDTAASMPKALIQKEQRVARDVNKLNKHLRISAKLLHRA